MATRIERDSLGPKEIPAGAYYGVQTLRAVENFPVSGWRIPRYLSWAYGNVKLACVEANAALGVLDETRAKALAQAAREVAEGRWDSEFVVDVFQAGAGTSTHMNVNEVITNRALEILGRPKGDYEYLSPNDHVNRGQSTNDTYPTALHVSVLRALQDVEESLKVLISSLERKAGEFRDIPKAGRTHLKDAMPVTLGAEFQAYASALQRLREGLPRVREGLYEVALGGSAVGSGINTVPGFRREAVARLAHHTGLPLVPARDPFETMQSRWAALAASSWLRSVAVELIRIANDLRLLSSGPATGLDEIRFPEVQPGSSIMPAKVNPSLAECLNMVAFHVVGSDTAVMMSVQAGQLEINVMMPLAAWEILHSCELFHHFLPVFAHRGIDGLEANVSRCEGFLVSSSALATVLTPRLGYLRVAEIIKKAQAEGTDPRKILVREGLLSEPEVQELLGPDALRRLALPVP
jgi:aspartate ammonia-lyase